MASLDPYVLILLLMAGVSWILILLAWALPRRPQIPGQGGGYRVEHVGLISGLGSFSLIALLLTGLLDVDNPVFPVSVAAVLLLILLLALAEYFYWKGS